MPPAHDSRFTGIFTTLGPLARRAADPDVAICAGNVPAWGARTETMSVGGAGWTAEEAKAACVGEAVERLAPYAHPADGAVESTFADWPLDEPAAPPASWVLFHPEQYAAQGFPFEPFTEDTSVRWTACREAGTGRPVWAPEEIVFLHAREPHRLGPATSTGLACGTRDHPVLRRGLQEILERDAVLGAWWGRYPVERWSERDVFRLLPTSHRERLVRPNLRYGFYRIASPYADHVTLTTLEGEDREGYCFNVGGGCREDRASSWVRSILEAVQGRHYVRYLLATQGDADVDVPATFLEHALYYTLHPVRLADTALAHAERGEVDVPRRNLGTEHPVLFRNLTPPWATQVTPSLVVLRVLVPGLQPLHGDHRLPFLGGPLWAPRGLQAFADVPPHPFP